MKKLLVPVDNSENALRALDFAINLSKSNGPIEVVIVHAHETPIIYGEVALYLPEEKARELQRAHSEEILAPALQMAGKSGVKFSSEILIGDVPRAIADCAEQNGCDAIVMGTRGMGAIGNLLMGSIAAKVIHLSKLPVVLVK